MIFKYIKNWSLCRGDAAIMAHFMEYCLITDLCQQGYDDKGNTFGTPVQSSRPERLRWNLGDEVQVILEGIQKWLGDGIALFNSVTLSLTFFTSPCPSDANTSDISFVDLEEPKL